MINLTKIFKLTQNTLPYFEGTLFKRDKNKNDVISILFSSVRGGKGNYVLLESVIDTETEVKEKNDTNIFYNITTYICIDYPKNKWHKEFLFYQNEEEILKKISEITKDLKTRDLCYV